MLASIAPYWDGNETWLVLGGGGLLVAFPRAYAIIMPAFYLPIIVMLLALVFRGVTFEFRACAQGKPLWDVVFAGGSTLAALCQGFILGGLCPGRQGRRRRLCRRRVRLGDAVRCAMRARRRCRLCAPRRDLADAQDRGRHGGARRGKAKVLLVRRARLHGRGQPLHALAFPRIAARWFAMPNLFICRRCRSSPALIAIATMARDRGAAGTRAVARHHRAVPARLSRAGDFELSPISCRRR